MTDKQIDLLVKANVQGKKDLDSVAKSISGISTALDEQGNAAKRGQKNIDQIQGSMAALALENKRLKESLSALSAFEKLNDRIATTEGTVARTKKTYEEFSAELVKNGNATKEQITEQNKLNGAHKAAETRLAKLKTSQAEASASLREFGLAGADAAASEARLTAVILEYGVALEKGRKLTNDYAAIRKAATEAEKLENEARAKSAQDLANKLGLINAQVAASRKKQADAAAQATAQKAADTKLGTLATDAEESAQRFTTLARASENLTPKIVSLRDAVNAIINPGQAARGTLSGLEGEVARLGTAVGSIKGPVTDYRNTLNQLEAAQKAISTQSGLVDSFARDVAALRTARKAFSDARSEVNQYAAAVRAGGDVGASFVGALARAEGAANSAAKGLKAQIIATRESKDALQAAGIATNDLAGTSARLSAASSTTVNSTKQLTAAMDQYGTSVADTAKKKISLWSGDAEGGRTTLSLFQRIRGEVLSLAASYVGLFGAVSTAKGALDAFNAREGAKNQLGISVGNDKAAIDAEYNYVKGQSDRIGVEFERSIKGYAKFSAAATLAGRGRQEIRYVFETFSEIGRVANLTADDLDGVFKALEQIYSKGKIQAEELRGQLGDRLFGAFEIAAKSLKDQFPDIDKAMKDGLITSDQLVKIAAEYKRIIADELPGATQSLAAQQMRMNNAVFDFKLAIADSGWADSYKNALIVLADFMRSADGIAAAKSFSQGLTLLANSFIWLLQNIELVKDALIVLASVFAVKQGLQMLTYLEGVASNLRLVSTQAGAATASVMRFAAAWPLLTTAVTRSLGAITAGFIGWEIGTWAYEKFAIVKEAGVGMVTGLDYVWNLIKGGFSMMFAALPTIARNAMAGIINLITLSVRNMLGIFAKLAGAAGLDDLEKNLNGAADSLKVGYGDVGSAIAVERAKMEAELKKINALRDEMLADIRNPKGTPAKSIAKGREYDAATDMPVIGNSKTDAGAGSEAAANKLQNLIDSIRGQLDGLEGAIDRAQTETLQKQLDGIDMRYEVARDHIEKLAKLDPKAAAEAMDRLIQLNMDAREVAINKFNKGLTDDFAALMSQLDGVEAAAGRKSKDSLKDRQDAIQLSYTGIFQKIAEMRAKYAANDMQAGVVQADAAKVALQASIDQLKVLEATKVAKEKLAKLEAAMNDIIKARDAKLGAVAAQKEVGKIDSAAAADQTNQINQDSVAEIQAAGQATRDWAMANQAVFANTAERDTFLATLDAVITKQGSIKTAFSDIENAALKGAVDGINSGLNSVVDNLQQVFSGQQSVADGFMGILQSFGQFAAKFLRDIAMMIIQQQIFTAMSTMGGGTGIFASIGKMGLGIKHDGGIVGQNGAGNRTRNVDPTWFASAPRYHSGGVPGLRADEYATILQKGEEVLAKDSPRNVMNGGGAGAAKSSDSGAGMRVVLVDDRSKVHEAMNSSEGERVIVQAIRRNIPSVKQMLKG